MQGMQEGRAVMNIAAKPESTPHDLGNAATLIALELSRAEANIAKIVEGLNANVDKPTMLRAMHVCLSNCCGELVAPINDAAEELRNSHYEGITARGPFVRRRS